MAERRDEAVVNALRDQVRSLEEELRASRRKLADSPLRVRALEERLLETKGQLAQAVAQNEKLSYTLREARDHISSLREEVEKLTQPPSAYGVVVGKNDDSTVDVLTNGRKMRVNLHPSVEHETLERGAEVVLNESLNIVAARHGEQIGEVVSIKEVMDDGVRVMVIGRADEERVCELADALRGVHLRSGDTVRLDPRTGFILEKLRGLRSKTSSSRRFPISPTRTSADSTTRSNRSPMRLNCHFSTRSCSPSIACRPPRAFCCMALRVAARP